MKEQLIERIRAAADDATHQALWNEGTPYRRSFLHPSEYKKRPEHLLSTMLNEGVHSHAIWASFLSVTPAEQQLYLNRNPDLKRYKRLYDLLKGQNAADQQNRPQKALLNFIDQHPTFVAKQLQFDADLRRHFFFLLTHANPAEFKPLLKLITKTPALASDFEDNITQVLNPTEDKKDHLEKLMHLHLAEKPSEDPVFKEFQEKMGRSLLVRDEILNAVLSANQKKFTPEFIAEVALHRQGNIAEYRTKLNSKLWKAGNFIKLWLLPHFIAQLFEPPITKETVDKMTDIISKLDEIAPQDPASPEDEIPLTVYPHDKIRFASFRRLLHPNLDDQHSVVPSDADTSEEEETTVTVPVSAQQEPLAVAYAAEPNPNLALPLQAVQVDSAGVDLAALAAGVLSPIAYPPALPVQPTQPVNKEAVSASPSTYVSFQQMKSEARRKNRAAKRQEAPATLFTAEPPAQPDDEAVTGRQEDGLEESSQHNASFLADLFGAKKSSVVKSVGVLSSLATPTKVNEPLLTTSPEKQIADASQHDASFFADLFGVGSQKNVETATVISTPTTLIKSAQVLSPPPSPQTPAVHSAAEPTLVSTAATPTQVKDQLFASSPEEAATDTSQHEASFLAGVFGESSQKDLKPAEVVSLQATPAKSAETLSAPSPHTPFVIHTINEELLTDRSETEEASLAALFDSVIDAAPVVSAHTTPIKSPKSVSAVPSPQTAPAQGVAPEAVSSTSMAPSPVPSPFARSVIEVPVVAVPSPLKASSAAHSAAATPVKFTPEAVSEVARSSPAATPVKADTSMVEEQLTDRSESEAASLVAFFDSVIHPGSIVSPYATPSKSPSAQSGNPTPPTTPVYSAKRGSQSVEKVAQSALTPTLPLLQDTPKVSPSVYPLSPIFRPPKNQNSLRAVLLTGTSQGLHAKPAPLDESEAAPVSLNESEAAPLALNESEAAPVSLNESEAAPLALNQSEAVPVALDESEAAPVALDESEAAPVALDESEAEPVALDQSEAAPVAHDEPEGGSEAEPLSLDGSEAASLSNSDSEAAELGSGTSGSPTMPVANQPLNSSAAFDDNPADYSSSSFADEFDSSPSPFK